MNYIKVNFKIAKYKYFVFREIPFCINYPIAMKILLLAATHKESEGILKTTNKLKCLEENFFRGFIGNVLVDIQVSGIGAVATTEVLTRRLTVSKYNLIINLGICGSFRGEYPIGTTVNIAKEIWGDLGAEDQNGFLDLFDLELKKAGEKPFTGYEMINPGNEYSRFFDHLPKLKGITVNKVHGKQESIDQIFRKYSPDVESLEGAAVFELCLRTGINFQCLRSISNFVEPRSRERWNVEEAMANLSLEINNILGEINK